MSKPSEELIANQETVLSGSNASYLEQLLESSEVQDTLDDESWKKLVESFASPPQSDTGSAHSELLKQFYQYANNQKQVVSNSGSSNTSQFEQSQVDVINLINSYRSRGHRQAKIDPLNLVKPSPAKELELQSYGLTKADMSKKFHCDHLFAEDKKYPLADIYEKLNKTYCASIGAEYMHLSEAEERDWIREQIEHFVGHSNTAYHLTAEERARILDKLVAAEGLEKFLGSKFPGVKRFGLEGAESLIPLLDDIIHQGSTENIEEIVIGMAHRGRLNVLVNIFGKKVANLVKEFEGDFDFVSGSGDVKYHQGYSSDIQTKTGPVHLALAFNPSHLEMVSPVVQGSVRARQDVRNDAIGKTVLPIILHGDAAFSGQGVVMETFQMSQTRAYKTGGTIHVVINNQVGFTTSKKEDARSTDYCTDVAKIVNAPIFHVNGDDPEAVVRIARLAKDYRQKFSKDIVIDLVCYRRRGHNEADEPSGTQPAMYKVIKKLPSTLSQYAKNLAEQEVIKSSESAKLVKQYRTMFSDGERVVKELIEVQPDKKHFDWSPHIGVESETHSYKFSSQQITELSDRLNQAPDQLTLQKQVKKVIEDRLKMSRGEQEINWGFAENVAYACLLNAGISIRMSGQDVGRGTFSHRHCVLHDQEDQSTYIPLKEIAPSDSQFEVYDSFLSELAVLGFEYGYSTTNPKTQVIWEAQFGDFANGAQIIIDQFITSGEHKWGRLSGLVLLLPHGYEGQGPEHSSARLERFLQLCAEHNIQVCCPTTPAQIFHLMLRQSLSDQRKPLVIMSPKSLLRHPEATSSIEQLANGSFQKVIAEQGKVKSESTRRVILCSGKVYYDLMAKKKQEKINDVAVIRIEQLYPFPEADLIKLLQQYKHLDDVVWCQEEPINQGAWYSSRHHLRQCVDSIDAKLPLKYAGREASAAPACGYFKMHSQQLEQFLQDAFASE